MDNAFVDWDDDHLLVNNLAFRGLGLDQLRWMFSTTLGGHYQPFTWLSYALDFKIWGGLNAAGVHFTNFLLHAATSVVVFFLTRRLITIGSPPHTNRAILAPLAASLLFAVHPLRVESVAWATERRDVLSGFSLVLATLSYVVAVQTEKPSHRRWLFLLTTITYAVSLLSKAVGLTWPVILLCLDVYPLRRIGPWREPASVSTWRGCIREKSFFFLLAVGSATAAIWAQRSAGALWTLADHALSLRIAQAAYGLVFYLWKTIWPSALLPLYEQRPGASPWDAEYLVAAGVGITLAVVVFLLRRRIPALLFGGLNYVILLAPTLGFAQSGPQVVADRYSYLPSLVISILVAAGIERLFRSAAFRTAFARSALAGGLTSIIVILIYATRAQVEVWSDTATLWTHVLDHAPRTGLAHVNLGQVQLRQGRPAIARDHGLQAIAILPNSRSAHRLISHASSALGDWPAAERHLAIAVELGTNEPGHWVELAFAQEQCGKLAEAETSYIRAIQLGPNDWLWHSYLAGLLARCGRTAESIAVYQQAVVIEPRSTASLLHRVGLLRERQGDYAGAIQEWDRVLQVAPRNEPTALRLAWTLATCPDPEFRDGPRALSIASAVAAGYEKPDPWGSEVLAAAHARTGNYDSAIHWVSIILNEKGALLDDVSKDRLNKQMNLYQAGLPYEHARQVPIAYDPQF